MKNLLFFFLAFSSLYPSQSFDYEKTYGTYYGSAVTELSGPDIIISVKEATSNSSDIYKIEKLNSNELFI